MQPTQLKLLHVCTKSLVSCTCILALINCLYFLEVKLILEMLSKYCDLSQLLLFPCESAHSDSLIFSVSFVIIVHVYVSAVEEFTYMCASTVMASKSDEIVRSACLSLK